MRTLVLPLACVAHIAHAQRPQSRPSQVSPASANKQRLTTLDTGDVITSSPSHGRASASDRFHLLIALAGLLGAQHPLAAFQHPYPGLCIGAHCPPGRSNFQSDRQHAAPYMASLTDLFTFKQRKAMRLHAGRMRQDKTLVKVAVIDPSNSADHVDQVLAKNEIVSLKFRSAESKREAAKMAEELAELTDAAVAQSIGKTALLYRPSERKVIPLDKLLSKQEPKKTGRDGREIDPNEVVTTILLNNLHPDVSEDQIRRDCEAFGPVTQVLLFHRRTDRASTNAAHVTKAFVRFETLGHAMDAMAGINFQRVQINGQSDVTAGTCYRNVEK